MTEIEDSRNKPFVSIVIPTYNRSALITGCVQSLLELEYPVDRLEIIIIDDGSCDSTSSVLSENFDLKNGRIKYLRNDNNRGAAASRNTGFRLASGDFIASLDDDCVVERMWLNDVVKTFLDFPGASAVGGSVVNPSESSLAQASHILEFSSWLPLGDPRRVNSIPTCNIVYKRSEIQGMCFPEELKGSVYEDTLFNLELIKSGKAIIFNPKIKVSHNRWSEGSKKNDFYESQARYASGFLKGGFKAHGRWGKLLIKYKVFNLLCPRLIFMFFRCARSKTYLSQFIRNFKWILCGEWHRNMIVYRSLP